MSNMLAAVVAPAQRYALRRLARRSLVTAKAAAFWKWRSQAVVASRAGGCAPLIWTGSDASRGSVLKYLNATAAAAGLPPEDEASCARVSDAWRPGAWKVPVYLDAVIDLDRPLDDTVAACGENIRRIIRRQAGRFTAVHVTDPAEVSAANESLLRPFAAARHGDAVAHLSSGSVERFARGEAGGRLTVLYAEGEPLACHLGFESFPHGRRTWNALRFGYSRAVFENPKLLEEVNTVNLYLAARWASENGFLHYNIGASMGNPDSGLLQWKCRRGARIDADRSDQFFYLQPPRGPRAGFFWVNPVYVQADGGPELVLGIPPRTDPEAVARRIRPLVVKGVRSVRVYAPSDVSAETRRLVDSFVGLGPDAPSVQWHLED